MSFSPFSKCWWTRRHSSNFYAAVAFIQILPRRAKSTTSWEFSVPFCATSQWISRLSPKQKVSTNSSTIAWNGFLRSEGRISQPPCFCKNTFIVWNQNCVKSTRFISKFGVVAHGFPAIAVGIRPALKFSQPSSKSLPISRVEARTQPHSNPHTHHDRSSHHHIHHITILFESLYATHSLIEEFTGSRTTLPAIIPSFATQKPTYSHHFPFPSNSFRSDPSFRVFLALSVWDWSAHYPPRLDFSSQCG